MSACRLLSAALGLLSFATAARSSEAASRPVTADRIARWLGPAAVSLLRQADRVEAFAVAPNPPLSDRDREVAAAALRTLPPGTPRTIRKLPVYGVGVVPADLAKRVAALVFDPRSYHPKRPPFDYTVIKGCAFAPGVAFRLWVRRRVVDVMVCFSCDQLMVWPEKQSWRIADTDDARPAFLALAKEVFAHLPWIAQLPVVNPRNLRPSGRPSTSPP